MVSRLQRIQYKSLRINASKVRSSTDVASNSTGNLLTMEPNEIFSVLPTHLYWQFIRRWQTTKRLHTLYSGHSTMDYGLRTMHY